MNNFLNQLWRASLVISGVGVINLFPLDVYAQEANDTTAQDLREVVVEGSMQTASADKVIYRPSNRIKNASQDATDLLQRMAIPQILVNPLTKGVTTMGGKEVSIFINYQAARQEDLQGLRTTDVRSVEYLDYPTDVRFRGVAHAINIIVQEYEYGGYTKLSDRQFILTGFSNYASIFSKFSYKKMIYDLYVAADNVSSNHVGSSEYSLFRLPKGDIERNSEFLSANFKYIDLPITFRASYTGNRVQISNTVGYKFHNRYKNIREGRLYFEPSNGTDYISVTDAPYENSALSWNGDYYFTFSNGWTLSTAPNFTYTRNSSKSRYTTTATDGTIIVNDAKEDAYNFGLQGSLRKQLNNFHTLGLNVNGGSIINDVEYSGTSPYATKMTLSYFGVSAGYNLNLQPKISLSVNAGIAGEFMNINSQNYNDSYPFANLSANFAPNNKHYIYAFFQFATNSPETAERSPNVIQVNELLYRTGTPLLKNSRFTEVSVNYTYMPNNRIMFTTYASYYGSYHRAITSYSLYENGEALISKYINSGDLRKVNAGINATLRLLNNSLVFQVSPSITHYNSTGYISQSWTPLSVSAYGQYYFKNFNFSAYWVTRSRSMNENTGSRSTSRSYYYLKIGWSNGNWNLSAYAANIFRKGYDGTWSDLTAPLYTTHTVQYNSNYHRSIGLTALYTFGYGKKINRGDEIGRQSDASSAIMR